MIAGGSLLAAFLVLPPLLPAALVGWGWNNQGQLGDGGTELTLAPKEITSDARLNGQRIVSLAAGFQHSLALTEDGQVWAWGLNDSGALGNGTTDRSLVPVLVSSAGAWGGRRIVEISAGYKHSVALTEDGNVFSWGINNYGQLGDGTTANRTVPVAVDRTGVLSGKTIRKVAAGDQCTVALTDDGQLFTWGLYGPFHSTDWTSLSSPLPLPVELGPLANKSIQQIAPGLGFTVVRTADGELYAWGSNEFGKLGDGSVGDRLIPGMVQLPALASSTRVVGLSVGWHHAVVLTDAGQVFTWGYGYNGQLGIQNPFGPTYRAVPVLVDFPGTLGGERITAVAAGALHSLAITERGRVSAWGFNQIGEAGIGLLGKIQYTPVPVTTSGVLCGERVTALARGAGTVHALALTETTTNGLPCLGSVGPVLRLRFAGTPAAAYQLERTGSLNPTAVWSPITILTADLHGVVTHSQDYPTNSTFWRVVPAP